MRPPVWVIELAARFWSLAGSPPPFPRDLGQLATEALRVRIIALPNLRLDSVRGWLARAGVPFALAEPDRPLRGCLAASGGAGFVFLDAADPLDEQRFSLAHEIAHFLRDYEALRQLVVRRIGPAGLDILDGRRFPTATERIHAVLRRVPLRAHVHVLRRGDHGQPISNAERISEEAADRLAFELLAPAELFARESCIALVKSRLETEFGFPPGPAANYAAILIPAVPIEGFVERLIKSR